MKDTYNVPVPDSIEIAKLGKRTLSMIIDIAIYVGLLFGLYYTLGIYGILSNNDYYPIIEQRTSYVVKTGLVTRDNDAAGTFDYLDFSDKEEGGVTTYAHRKYMEVVWNYFTVVIPQEKDSATPYQVNLELKRTYYNTAIAPFTSDIVKDGKITQEYGKWVYQYYFGYEETLSPDNIYFAPSVEGDYTSAPDVVVDEDEYRVLLKNKMFSKGTSSVYGFYADAVNHVSYQPIISQWNSRMNAAAYAAKLPCLTLAPFIVFFLIPLCVPNGRTLGKLIMGLAVIDDDYHRKSRLFLGIRQLIVTVMFFSFALPWTVVSILAFVALAGVDFVFVAAMKRARSIEDFVAKTVVIDARKSKWFKSDQEEEDYISSNPKSDYSKAKMGKEEEVEDAFKKAERERYEKEATILDLSTINRAREEARKITSFDEFEASSTTMEEPIVEAEITPPAETPKPSTPSTNVDNDPNYDPDGFTDK